MKKVMENKKSKKMTIKININIEIQIKYWRHLKWNLVVVPSKKNKWKMILRFWRPCRKIFFRNWIFMIGRKVRRKSGRNCQAIFLNFDQCI